MTLRVKLFGSLLVENESGTPSELMKLSKGCALLAYLIATGRPQTREVLADLLWDAASTAQSLQNLRKLLSRMRQWVPELEVTRRQVAYKLETAVFIDYQAITTALESGRSSDIAEALQFYEGDLLQGFYINDAPRFNEWLLIEREQLRHRITAAYRQVCFTYAEQQAWQKGIHAAQRWQLLDPFDEDALRHLMQMLAGGGQVASALQQYSLSRQRLWDELGVEPEQATLSLAQKLTQMNAETNGRLAWDLPLPPQIDWPNPASLADPGPLPPLSTMPYQRNLDFTGRCDSLLYLAKMLLPWPEAERGSFRAVAISGMGGLGKTQLAVEFCYRYGRYFPGGVFWLNFADAHNVAAEVAAVGGERGMGLFREAEHLTLVDQVGQVQRAWQEPIPRLLIFDNCEDQALLAQWMPVTGGCRVLVTSHRSYWARELRVAEWPLSVLEPLESEKLLCQLAPVLTLAEAAEIAAELGHLPLALHLAGGFLNRYQQVSVGEYLFQLRNKGLMQHPSLTGRGISHSPTGHQLNVSRTFTISFEQLDPTDEVDRIAWQLLARAACFAPGEPIPQDLLLATVVENEQRDGDQLMALLTADDSLRRLIALGILQGEASGQVVLHRLLATFTIDFLDIDQSVQRAVENVLLRILSTYSENERNLYILPLSATHLKHITHLTFARQDNVAFRLGIFLGSHLRDVGDFKSAHHYLKQSLTAASKARDIHGQAEAWIALSKAQEHSQEILHCTEQAELLLRTNEIADQATLAAALHYKGWAYYQMGRAEEALSAAKEGLVLCEVANARLLMGDILNLLSMISYYMLGKFEDARRYQERALAIFRELGSRHAESTVLNNMAESARLQGDYALASEFYREALDIARDLGNLNMVRLVRSNLGGALVGLKAYEAAVAELEDLLSYPSLNWRILSEIYRFLAEARLGQGKLKLALEAARQALALGQNTNNVPYDVGRAWRVLGQLAAHMDQSIRVSDLDTQLYDAPTCFAKSIEIFTQIEVPRDRAMALWNWADYEMLHGNLSAGNQMRQIARSIFEELNLKLLINAMDCELEKQDRE